MSAEPITLEVMPEQSQLLAVVQQNNLPAEAAQSLQASFAPAFSEARTVMNQSRGIVVTDASQKLQIKLARECRLALRNIRVGADKTRKELKEASLRQSRGIDGFYNVLVSILGDEEERLEKQEKFVEVQEFNRKAALKVAREEIAVSLGIDPMLYSLGEMSEETFATLIEGTKLARAAQEEARKKAEADKIAKEAADQAERARIREENARLAREAAEKEEALKVERERVAKEKADAEAVAKAERERAEATLKAEKERLEAIAKAEREKAAEAAKELAAQQEANRKEKLRLQALAEVERQKQETARKDAEAVAKREREAREKLEKEQREREAAEAKRKQEADDAARKAAARPDKDKLLTYANTVRAMQVPTMATLEGGSIGRLVESQREKFALWIEEKAGAL